VSAASASVRRRPGPDVAAIAGLALATLGVLWPLGLTNRVLAGIDALTYFTPYWAYRNEALRAGRIPLWNPHLFFGAPFLANIQSAVLYPLHWPLAWLPAERAIIWSAILHAWLAAVLMYALARRSLRLTPLAGFLAGAVFGLGGFALARVENINQLNGLAWLPGLLWMADETLRAANGRSRIRRAIALVVLIALSFLAGHTQTFFVNMVALALYLLFTALLTVEGPRWRRLALLAAAPVAMAAAAAQLLPTLELMTYGWRSGGLAYRQAASFSLQPRLLLQSFFPPYGGGLAQSFSSEGYAEFVAYAGIAASMLAIVGFLTSWRRWRAGAFGAAQAASLGLLALAGLFFALGAYNPVYYLLWRFAPGFDLFRAPVRWLALYAVGVAGLAGYGLDAVASQAINLGARVRRELLLVTGIVAITLLAVQTWPGWRTTAAWIAVAALATALLLAARRGIAPARYLLVGLAMVELWVGARALPFTLATAPMALSLRNAPATLLSLEEGPSAGRERFLSLSDIRFDPGDLGALRALQADRLSPDAVERMVRAAKLMEVIAPNLSLYLGLPAADGYDGGLLPTQDYVDFTSLFLQDVERLPDGRLREQLTQTPDARLLDLAGITYVITDKQHDLWADDVYYDLEHSAVIQPGQSVRLDLRGRNAPFTATGIGVVTGLADEAPPGEEAAEVIVETEDGPVIYLDMMAGVDTDWSQASAPGARVARTWPDTLGDGRDYLARLKFPEPAVPTAISVRVPPDAAGALVLRGLSLLDGRTGAHTSVTVSQRGDLARVHSGDVKVYRRTGAPGRAWLAHGLLRAASVDEAIERMADPEFDPRTTAILEGNTPERTPERTSGQETVEAVEMAPERQTYRVNAGKLAALVVADAYYPGWRAIVDGYPAKIDRANGVFRGVLLDGGRHAVTFEYQPESWRWGVIISLTTLGLLVAAAAATFLPRRDV
jgi:hypothetical protein